MKPISARASLVALLLAASFAPRAQAQADPRWRAWLGCWTMVQADSAAPGTAMCVVPATGTSAVDIVQIADLQVIARSHIDADASRHPSVRDNCGGWDRAEWSPDGWQLLLHAEHDCAGGEHRVTTAIMQMQGGGEWVTVLGANAAGRRSVQVQHYRMALGDLAIPEEVIVALDDSLAARPVVRVADVPTIGTAEIIAANQQVDLFVLEAWLATGADPVRFNGRQMVQLADGGVQPSTIDVLVGLANPGVFRVAARPPVREQIGGAGAPGAVFFPVGYPRGAASYVYSDSAMRCNAFYNMWQMSPTEYRYTSAYCGGYRYGQGYGWYDQQPQVQVVAGSGAHAAPSGRAVNGRGYTTGREQPDRPSADRASSGTDTNTRQEGAAASPGGYGAGSPTSTPTERTAIPRPETGDRRP